MNIFLSTVRRAFELGSERSIYVSSGFLNEEFCHGWNFMQWWSQLTDEVLSNFVKDLFTAAVFIDTSFINADAEFKYIDTVALGLGAAFTAGGVAVSFDSHSQWNCDVIELRRLRISEESGELGEDVVRVRHALHPHHIDTHEPWIRNNRNAGPYSLEGATFSIHDCLRESGNFGSSSVARFDFGDDFLQSAKQHGFFFDHGVMRHLLVETCARIVAGVPKNDLNNWNTAEFLPGWRAYRTHLTKSGPGFRVMFWVHPNGTVIFANVGPKFEEAISYAIPARLLDREEGPQVS